MFKRFKHLKLSLAAKCQLLLGSAVALIIAAVLVVPWQRMEQLTVQLNERTAAALTRSALAEHMSRPPGRLQLLSHPVSSIRSVPDPAIPSISPMPTSRLVVPAVATTTTRPVPSSERAKTLTETFPPPRLVAADTRDDSPGLTPLERRALKSLHKDPDQEQYERLYETKDGTQRYFYAAALYAQPECIQCHQAQQKGPGLALVAATQPFAPASQPRGALPASRPDKDALLGIISIDIPSQIDANQLLLNRVLILLAGLVGGVLALIVFYPITMRVIIQPVRVLQETAEKVSQGDLDIRSDINTGDEYQQLSETFNTMLINLKAGEDQLRAINKSLDMKLGQLAESNVALYESNRLKSEFLANVSHELRTPLNSILGFADLLKDALANHPDAKTTRYAHNILNSGRNLLDLINDLLDLAKIEAGRMEVRSEPLSLSDLFEGLTNILKPLCETKNVTIAATVGADVPIINTDPAKLQQILYNFLSNAIKFSPVGSTIELAAQRHGEENVRISVTDHGAGIDPAKQEIIFEKFRQIDGSVTRQHGGSGLGLSISKELVLLLSGSIGVRSTPAEGATFWVVLPLNIQPGTQDLRSRGPASTPNA